MRQGEPATNLYFVYCGTAKLTHITPGGHQTLQRFLRPGESYGLAAALDNADFAWSLQAIETCTTLVWSTETVSELMERYNKITLNMLEIAVKRRREMQERYMTLLTFTVEQRLASALIQLCSEVGCPTSEGCLIDVALSRAEIWPNTLERLSNSVSRSLQKWERQQWVRTQRERVVVLNIEALRSITTNHTEED